MTNRKTYTHPSQSDIARQIERLVQAIEGSDSPAFRIKQAHTGYERVQETKLSRYFDHIQQMVDLCEGRIEVGIVSTCKCSGLHVRTWGWSATLMALPV